jgi:hypothetical protein
MNRFKYDDLSMLGACRSSVKAALGSGLLPCGCQETHPRGSDDRPLLLEETPRRADIGDERLSRPAPPHGL